MEPDGPCPPDRPAQGPQEKDDIRALLLRLLRLVAAEVARSLVQPEDTRPPRSGGSGSSGDAGPPGRPA
jgi:hypothetical protein